MCVVAACTPYPCLVICHMQRRHCNAQEWWFRSKQWYLLNLIEHIFRLLPSRIGLVLIKVLILWVQFNPQTARWSWRSSRLGMSLRKRITSGISSTKRTPGDGDGPNLQLKDLSAPSTDATRPLVQRKNVSSTLVCTTKNVGTRWFVISLIAERRYVF